MGNKEIYTKLTTKIVALMDKGVVAWQRPWARTKLESPMNAVAQRQYTGGNFIVMSMWTWGMGYSHPLYMTMHQIDQLNEMVNKTAQMARIAIMSTIDKLTLHQALYLLRRNATRFLHVRKGEPGYPVIYFKPLQFENKEGRIDPKTGEVALVSVPFAEVYYVWNVAQIEGLQPDDLPAYAEAVKRLPELRDFTPVATAEELVARWAAQLNGLYHEGESAHYRPSADVIACPVQGRFTSDAEYYMTIFHEMIHSTGHATRLGRDLTGDKMTEKYGREELVAEMGAVYLAGLVGIEPTFDNSAAYLAGWKQRCADDPQILYWAALRAQEAVDYILSSVNINLHLTDGTTDELAEV